ncbi:P34 thiol protease [Spatholobus suberectus]|nr:P34 thiol protease [Spatholobus suberectus]
MGPNLDKLPSLDEAIQLFQLWKREHGRVYKDLEEMAKKFEIDVKNIIESNAKRTSYPLGLNQFSDWSHNELQQTYLHELAMPANSDMNLNEVSCSAPPSLDWRSKGVVTEVKDQSWCGKLLFFGKSFVSLILP